MRKRQTKKNIKKAESKAFPPLACGENRPVTWQYQLDRLEGANVSTNSVTILSRPVLDYDWSGEHCGEFAVVTLTRAEIAEILRVLEDDIAKMRHYCPSEEFV